MTLLWPSVTIMSLANPDTAIELRDRVGEMRMILEAWLTGAQERQHGDIKCQGDSALACTRECQCSPEAEQL